MFVRQVAGDQTQVRIAAQSGIDQTTISRWFRDAQTPSPAAIIQFARAYHVNPVDALVAAGALTADEAGMPHHLSAPLDAIPTGRLVAELARRNHDAEAAS